MGFMLVTATQILSLASATHSDLSYLQQRLGYIESNRCGPIALQICSNSLGLELTHDEVTKHFKSSGELVSFEDLQIAADQLMLSSLAVHWEDSPKIPVTVPAILRTERNGKPHFIAALRSDGNRVFIVDVPVSSWLTVEQLRDTFHWNGDALHLAVDDWSITLLRAQGNRI